ncbi:MAG: DUF1304 domain-containing protein [Gemmatimonadaceae bacterium]
MNMLATIAIWIVAALHAGFLVLESFLWRTPTGRRIFGLTPEFAEQSASLAANQGLYNGFLAAGLVWAATTSSGAAYSLKLFFLGCVIIAGVVGAITAKRSILYVQAMPAAIALALVIVTR